MGKKVFNDNCAWQAQNPREVKLIMEEKKKFIGASTTSYCMGLGMKMLVYKLHQQDSIISADLLRLFLWLLAPFLFSCQLHESNFRPNDT